MDRRRASRSCSLLFILSILSFHSKVIFGSTSVVFLNGPTHQYVRQQSAQINSLSPSEVGAVASVLLGLAPPSSLSAASSSKLNEVLVPNPFERPRVLLILEVTGAEDFSLNGGSFESPFTSAVRVNVEGDQKVDLHLPGEGEVYAVPLNGTHGYELSDNEISDFASWLGGSYVEKTSRSLSGELTIPVANGAFIRLHMAEEADRKFTMNLLFLVNGIKDAKDTHKLLTKGSYSPAELIHGKFDGIKTLKEHYGKEGIAQIGLDVFAAAISKAFNFLESSYDGKIVGVIGHGFQSVLTEEHMFDVSLTTPRASSRALQESQLPPDPSQIAEVLFVRTTLVWITGIILLIATILGVSFLMYMPITKDTLLYSNIKLD